LLAAAAAACTLAAAQEPPPAPPAFAPFATKGGLVFVSGILPAAPAAGDGTIQASQVLDELKSRLAAAGTSMDRVVSTSVYLAEAGDFAALNAVWSKYWPSSPPARTTVVARLPVPGARVMVSAVAAGRGTARTVVLPKGWAAPASPFSYAVRAGDTLFLSGLVPRRGADNALVTGDIEAQTNAIFENAGAILAEAGLTLADVVSARVFLTDGEVFQRMNAAYRARFPESPPARATVITPLVSRDFAIEIAMVAVAGPGRAAVLTPGADGSPGKPNPNLSSAIRVGPRVFLSGMLGVLPGNAADAAGQTAETLNRLERTLAGAGFGWPDVAESIVYVTDMSAAADVLKVFAGRADVRRLAGTVIGTGLVSPEGRVEIMLNAIK
jgi:reactive intermediate/imine deaminase